MLRTTQNNFKSVSEISSTFKLVKLTSMGTADPLAKALESFNLRTIKTLIALYTSLICKKVKLTLVYDVINKPITLRTWLNALLVYCYIPQSCLDSYSQEMTAAIVLSGVTGNAFTQQMSGHTYRSNVGNLIRKGIHEASEDKIDAGFAIPIKGHGIKFVLPMNISKEGYCPCQSKTHISPQTKLNIAGETTKPDSINSLLKVPILNSDSALYIVETLNRISSSFPTKLLEIINSYVSSVIKI